MNNLLIYSKNAIKNIELKDFNRERLKQSDTMWLDIENPSVEDYDFLQTTFNFHTLALEDCQHKSQRAKIDDYKDHHFIVLTTAHKDNMENERYIPLYIFMGRNYIVTLHNGNSSDIKYVREQIVDKPSIMQKGTDFILYSIFDRAVDQYFILTDEMEETIDYLQDEAMINPVQEILNKIMIEKRNLLKFRKIISPQREVLNVLLRMDCSVIKEQHRMYFADIYDHILRVYDMIDSNQEVLSACLELYSSQLSNKMNEVMKVLTIITTIMAPLTVITGLYGMNFDNMPELHTKYGYFGVLIFIALIVTGELIYLRKKKWL